MIDLVVVVLHYYIDLKLLPLLFELLDHLLILHESGLLRHQNFTILAPWRLLVLEKHTFLSQLLVLFVDLILLIFIVVNFDEGKLGPLRFSQDYWLRGWHFHMLNTDIIHHTVELYWSFTVGCISWGFGFRSDHFWFVTFLLLLRWSDFTVLLWHFRFERLLPFAHLRFHVNFALSFCQVSIQKSKPWQFVPSLQSGLRKDNNLIFDHIVSKGGRGVSFLLRSDNFLRFKVCNRGAGRYWLSHLGCLIENMLGFGFLDWFFQFYHFISSFLFFLHLR